MRKHARLGTVLAVALASLAAAAHAEGPADQQVTTQSWQAKIPGDWKQVTRRKYSGDERIGRWVYESPNGNLRLRVNVAADTGGAFADHHKTTLARMTDKADETRILKEEVAGDYSYVLLKGTMLRKNFMNRYFIYRMLSRNTEDKLLITVTLLGTEQKLDGFNDLVGRIVGSFEPVKKPAKTPAKGR